MIVFVVETINYPEDWYVLGVAASPEAAERSIKSQYSEWRSWESISPDGDSFQLHGVNPFGERMGFRIVRHEVAE